MKQTGRRPNARILGPPCSPCLLLNAWRFVFADVEKTLAMIFHIRLYHVNLANIAQHVASADAGSEEWWFQRVSTQLLKKLFTPDKVVKLLQLEGITYDMMDTIRLSLSDVASPAGKPLQVFGLCR